MKFPECSIQLFAEDLLKGLQYPKLHFFCPVHFLLNVFLLYFFRYLHSHGIIFCDLKPSNLLFNSSGILKFCDFGHSRRITDYNGTQQGVRVLNCFTLSVVYLSSCQFSSFSSLPRSQFLFFFFPSLLFSSPFFLSSGLSILYYHSFLVSSLLTLPSLPTLPQLEAKWSTAKWATPCYMAPELFSENGVHSFASDFWSLGCVLYPYIAFIPSPRLSSYLPFLFSFCASSFLFISSFLLLNPPPIPFTAMFVAMLLQFLACTTFFLPLLCSLCPFVSALFFLDFALLSCAPMSWQPDSLPSSLPVLTNLST